MTRGVMIFYVMLALILAISIAAGLGVPDTLGVGHDVTYDEDVQAVVDAMTEQEQPNTGTSTFADFTIGGGRALQSGWQVITNTDAVLRLLTGMPQEAAGPIQTFFRIVFGVSFAQFIRGVVIE